MPKQRPNLVAVLFIVAFFGACTLVGWVQGERHCNHVLTRPSLYISEWRCEKCGRVFSESWDPKRGLIVMPTDSATPTWAKIRRAVTHTFQ